MRFLHTVLNIPNIFQKEKNRMTTIDFITELFCRIDEAMADVPKHPQASLYPSEVVTLAFLFAMKGVGNRAFYRWLQRDWREYFPSLPERTRLFRLFTTHQEWTAGADTFPFSPGGRRLG
jgi:hypothetical protein